ASVLAAKTRPTSVADPVRSSTANASAIGTRFVPKNETVLAENSSAKFRSRRGPIASNILRSMPTYQVRGEVPRKRHIQFRDNGTLLTEEVMGLEGFSGNESILYHLTSPCR